MRDETEWVETVQSGWNRLTGAKTEKILAAMDGVATMQRLSITPYGDGNAAALCLKAICEASNGSINHSA
jgi:UDP-GlcNAc3NAcA epimerase